MSKLSGVPAETQITPRLRVVEGEMERHLLHRAHGSNSNSNSNRAGVTRRDRGAGQELCSE